MKSYGEMGNGKDFGKVAEDTTLGNKAGYDGNGSRTGGPKAGNSVGYGNGSRTGGPKAGNSVGYGNGNPAKESKR